MRAQSKMDCAWANVTQAFDALRRAPIEERQQLAERIVLPMWVNTVQAAQEMFTALLESTTNIGEMGVVADLMDSKLSFLNETNRELLVSSLGRPLPSDAVPEKMYMGRSRLFSPTLRPFVEASSALVIRGILLVPKLPDAQTLTLLWRELGDGNWSSSTTMRPLRLLQSGGVYEGSIPADHRVRTLEWMLSAELGTGPPLIFPATAPAQGQSVVVLNVVHAAVSSNLVI